MDLVVSWWMIVSQLSVAFSRKQTFYWAIISLLGFCTRQDFMGGLTGFMRSIGIRSKYYQRLDDFFHSDAINLDKLSHTWSKIVFNIFCPFLLTINKSPILILDGINNSKEGKKMPGVQSLHQVSNTIQRPNMSWDTFFNVLEY